MNESVKEISEPPSRPMTVGTIFHDRASANRDKPAIIFPDLDRCMTYGEMDDISDDLARALIASGLTKGSHAAIWAVNIPEFPMIQLGCAKAGVPIIGLNTNYLASDLENILIKADIRILFISLGEGGSKKFVDSLYEICPELRDSNPGHLSSPRCPHLRTVVFIGDEGLPGIITWKKFLASGETVHQQVLEERVSSVCPDDSCFMFLTSGTTGKPKCSVATHRGILGNIIFHSACLGLTPDDICCSPLSLFHAYGPVVLLTAFTKGCTAIQLARFNATQFLKAIEVFHVTHIFGTPTMFVAALAEADWTHYDTSSLSGGDMAGSFAQPALARAVMDKLGAKEFGILYGLSEAICVTMTDRLDPVEYRSGSVGRPMPQAQIRIIDCSSGKDVPAGVCGEILFKGPFMTVGYYNDPDATAMTIDAEGFLHTGDLGYVDEQGYFHIAGRSKDVIIRGGENIYPTEIEEVLLTHPSVLDAQVVGVKSEYFGEEPVAFIRSRPGMEVKPLQLKQYCRKTIAIEKVPADFFMVQEFPLTPSGKVKKYMLREMAEDILRERNKTHSNG